MRKQNHDPSQQGPETGNASVFGSDPDGVLDTPPVVSGQAPSPADINPTVPMWQTGPTVPGNSDDEPADSLINSPVPLAGGYPLPPANDLYPAPPAAVDPNLAAGNTTTQPASPDMPPVNPTAAATAPKPSAPATRNPGGRGKGGAKGGQGPTGTQSRRSAGQSRGKNTSQTHQNQAGNRPAPAAHNTAPANNELKDDEKTTVDDFANAFEDDGTLAREKFKDTLEKAFGKIVTENISEHIQDRIRTEEKLIAIVQKMIAEGRGANMDKNVAFRDALIDTFQKAHDKDEAIGRVRGHAPNTAPAQTPEQRERAAKLNAAADKLAALKAVPFRKRDQAAIDAAKDEYDAIASEVAREFAAGASDEATRKASFGAALVASWDDINARAAVLRGQTKYGRIVNKIGGWHPVARMAVMATGGVVFGAGAATAGLIAGGGIVAAGLATGAVVATKMVRAKISADVSMSLANQQRTRGKFDALVLKFSEVSGIAKMNKWSEGRLQKKYDRKSEIRKNAIREQAAQEGWSDDQLIAKLARVDAGQKVFMDRERRVKVVTMSMGAVALGMAGGALLEPYAAEAVTRYTGLGAHHNDVPGQLSPTNGDAGKPAGGNQLPPLEAFAQSHQIETDWLRSNGRIHHDFNNITPDKIGVPGDAGHFPGYSELKIQYSKSPVELAAQVHQIQEIQLANNQHFDALPPNLQLQPGESPDAYAARLSDALHHDQALHDRVAAQTLDYVQQNGKLEDLTQSYYSWWIDENGVAHLQNSTIWSGDTTDRIVRLAGTNKGIRYPCGQPIELVPVQQSVSVPVRPAAYVAPQTPVYERPIPQPVYYEQQVVVQPVPQPLPPPPPRWTPPPPRQWRPQGKSDPIPFERQPNHPMGSGDREGNTPKPVIRTQQPPKISSVKPPFSQGAPRGNAGGGHNSASGHAH